MDSEVKEKHYIELIAEDAVKTAMENEKCIVRQRIVIIALSIICVFLAVRRQ